MCIRDSVKTAIVMLQAGVDVVEATRLLAAADGSVLDALKAPR